MKYYILYNPLAGSGTCEQKIEKIRLCKDCETVCYDVTAENAYADLAAILEKDDKIVICGGDGTLNRFVNGIDGYGLENDILYFAAGSGNDFLNDIGEKPGENPLKINPFIENLSRLYVNGKSYLFLNGIGFGLDGYACRKCEKICPQKLKIVKNLIAVSETLEN